MKYVLRSFLMLALTICSAAVLCANEYESKLFKSIELIYEEQFEKDGPHIDTEQWTIRQNTQWNVKDGVLVGEIADEEYQKMMQAKNDGHDGTRPVIWLNPVPKAFVIQMRVRYDETNTK